MSNGIVLSTTTALASMQEAADLAIADIQAFEEWFGVHIDQGQPLTVGERLILKDYIYWKLKKSFVGKEKEEETSYVEGSSAST